MSPYDWQVLHLVLSVALGLAGMLPGNIWSSRVGILDAAR
jgi:hypothetical protein